MPHLLLERHMLLDHLLIGHISLHISWCAELCVGRLVRRLESVLLCVVSITLEIFLFQCIKIRVFLLQKGLETT